mmetsp:Transcript_40377/g.108354  ORF Transcript_40377/g.108354 Transcript_40377/m.108354 type:complete len:251 (+) Transcript_40377:1061-1813(+)
MNSSDPASGLPCGGVVGLIARRTQMEVRDKMHAQVLPQVDKLDVGELAQRRRDLFQRYLEASNTKKVYLDEVDPAMYDPFSWMGNNLRYTGGSAGNSAKKGDDADPRLGEDPTQRELFKRRRELRLARTIGSDDAGPGGGDVTPGLTSSLEGKEKLGYGGNGNPHMQGTGKRGDMVFRPTVDTFWWSQTNFKNSQYYDRATALKEHPKTAPPVQMTHVDLDEYSIPRGPAVLDREFEGLYGRGKRTQNHA